MTHAQAPLRGRRFPLARPSPVATLLTLGLLACGGHADAEPAPTPPRGADAAMTTTRWTKPTDAELRARLTPLQYRVTREDATEPPFQNAFWDKKGVGLYVDITTGEPLFVSSTKFDSGTGWPSFSQPVGPDHVVMRVDRAHGMVRTEVRSHVGDAHLGHVFPDGPAPTGLRFCINSAALRFVPVDAMVTEGYGEWLPLLGRPAAQAPAATAGWPDGGVADNTCVKPPEGAAPGCASGLETAILAGGCFWGMEEILRQVPGVLDVDVGYVGGQTANPTYRDVKTGASGHAEAVRVVFDPKVLAYSDLLDRWFFRMHDPTTTNRQGNDIGTQYRSAIFPLSPAQEAEAKAAIARAGTSGRWKRPVVTTIEQPGPYTPAEDYHQDYLVKNPGGYTCHFMRD